MPGIRAPNATAVLVVDRWPSHPARCEFEVALVQQHSYRVEITCVDLEAKTIGL
jgi:hypothetical protein